MGGLERAVKDQRRVTNSFVEGGSVSPNQMITILRPNLVTHYTSLGHYFLLSSPPTSIDSLVHLSTYPNHNKIVLDAGNKVMKKTGSCPSKERSTDKLAQ